MFFNNPILPTVFLNSLSYQEQILMLANEIYQAKQIYESGLSDTVKKYINDTFNEMMIDAIYDNENEQIILKRSDSL